MKHWRFALVALILCGIWTASRAEIIGGGVYGVFKPAGGGCSAYTTWIARTSGTSGTEQSAYQTMICGMITDGVGCSAWSGSSGNIDALYIVATNSSTTALLNLCSTSFLGLEVNAPTFSADHGYTGNGTSSYVDSRFTASTAGGSYAQNSASLGAYVTNNRTTASTACATGNHIGVTTGDSYLAPMFTGSVTLADINSPTNNSSASTTSRGSWIESRTGASTGEVYLNAAADFALTGTSSGIPDNSNIFLACRATSGGAPSNFSADTIAAGFTGGGLNSTQAAAMSNRINGYMTALGINVY